MGHSREYEATHNWLDFRLDLRRFDPEFWMLMGEARSKVEHIAGVPLRPATNRELHTLYLAKGIHGTAAIEGNTLTEEQVREHLETRLELPPSQEYLTRELDNIVAAFNTARDFVLQGEAQLTPQGICTLNGLILKDLDLEQGVVPGQFRTHGAVVGPYLGAPARDCPYLVRRLCVWLSSDEFERRDEFGVSLDILRAVLAHLYMVWIHPFGDGNGRTARLLEAVLLMARGVPTPAAHLLSNHYNVTRTEYYRRLDEARRSPDHLTAFLKYAVRGFVDQLREQIEVIRTQQKHQAWQDYVEETFRGHSGATAYRQRLVALELGSQKTATRRADVPALSAAIAAAYAGKGPKTISRDINALLQRHLIRWTPKGYEARTEVVSAFLPTRADLNGQDNVA